MAVHSVELFTPSTGLVCTVCTVCTVSTVSTVVVDMFCTEAIHS